MPKCSILPFILIGVLWAPQPAVWCLILIWGTAQSLFKYCFCSFYFHSVKYPHWTYVLSFVVVLKFLDNLSWSFHFSFQFGKFLLLYQSWKSEILSSALSSFLMNVSKAFLISVTFLTCSIFFIFSYFHLSSIIHPFLRVVYFFHKCP